MSNANTHIILEQAKREGYITLRQAGYEKVLNVITSLTEINRVTQQ
jgi:type II secretory ATPase GspE/PulE/Tfp pilus assembly ATPase PilB-like protein